jgi:hypothetical protein
MKKEVHGGRPRPTGAVVPKKKNSLLWKPGIWPTQYRFCPILKLGWNSEYALSLI